MMAVDLVLVAGINMIGTPSPTRLEDAGSVRPRIT